MNKFTTVFAVVSAVFLAAACDKSETPVAESGERTVSYTVSFPQTKATLGNGEAVNYVWYALYNEQGRLLMEYAPQPVNADGKAECKVTMMFDQNYKVVFVGQHYEVAGELKTPAFAIDAAKAEVQMPLAAKANSDNYDLFTYVDQVSNYQGGNGKDVSLTRILAQVNFFCTADDWTNAAALSMTPTASSMQLASVPSRYNVLTGIASTQTVTVEYAKNALTPDANLLGTAFCLAGENLTATLNLFKGDELTTTRTVSNVPAQLNYRTNITGQIMTGSMNYTISINPTGTDQNKPLN